MKNYFNFKIGDYVYEEGWIFMLHSDNFETYFSDPNTSYGLVPVPFSFKVLECMSGYWHSYEDHFLNRRHFYDIEIWRDCTSKFLYVIEGDKRIYLKHLHEFQRYLTKYTHYDFEANTCRTDLTRHLNDLFLIPDYVIKNGKPSLNKKAFPIKGKHFGYLPFSMR